MNTKHKTKDKTETLLKKYILLSGVLAGFSVSNYGLGYITPDCQPEYGNYTKTLPIPYGFNIYWGDLKFGLIVNKITGALYIERKIMEKAANEGQRNVEANMRVFLQTYMAIRQNLYSDALRIYEGTPDEHI